MASAQREVPRILVLSLSASQSSVSRSCLPVLLGALKAAESSVRVCDIRDLPPIWVDSRDLGDYPAGYADLYSLVEQCEGVIMLLPIYCYTMSSPAKSISEIIGDALEWKPVALVTAAGSQKSHLAARDLITSMMYEQHTVCYPYAVQATEDMFSPEGEAEDELRSRLETLAAGFVAFVRAVGGFCSDQVTR